MFNGYCNHLAPGDPAEWPGSGAALGHVKGTRSELQQPGGCGEGRMEARTGSAWDRG